MSQFQYELKIEWKYYEKNADKDLNQWIQIKRSFDEAMCDIESYARPRGVRVILVETPIERNEKNESNIILFNGVPIENLLTQVKMSEKERIRQGMGRVFIVAAATKIINSFQQEDSLEDPTLSYCYSLTGTKKKHEYQQKLKKTIIVTSIALVVWALMFANLHSFSHWFCYKVLGLSSGEDLSRGAEYFIFTFLKIAFLLGLVSSITALYRSVIDLERFLQMLKRNYDRKPLLHFLLLKWGILFPWGGKKAAELFASFLEERIAWGPVFTFMMASFLINEINLVIVFALFGPLVFTTYLMIGMITSLLLGALLGLFSQSRHLKLKMGEISSVFTFAIIDEQDKKWPWIRRRNNALHEVKNVLRKTMPLVLLGMLIASGLVEFVPADFIPQLVSKEDWWILPVSYVVAIPLYLPPVIVLCSFMPLLFKGLFLGPIMVFTMTSLAGSLPQILIWRKIFYPSIILLMVFVLGLCFVGSGFLFNQDFFLF